MSSFVDFAISLGLAAAQAQGSPYYRGPAVVYVPPSYSQPMPAPPPAYRALPVQQRALSRDEQREAVISAGERFCMRFPDDRVCHPAKDQPGQ
jgi:hypothetical protein